jgi:YegS/Rv2252/BmrU family lipid kinase
MTRSALRAGADRILAVGGDGTVHEVVNGFYDDGQPVAPEAVLAHLPCGTGGDFRRALGVPAGLDAASVLQGGRIRAIDLMRVTCRTPAGEAATSLVANVASCGLGGVVVQVVRHLPTPTGTWLGPFGGTLAYFVAILYGLAVSASDAVTVDIDGRTLGRIRMRTIAVANGPSFGGGLRIAPEARVDDGLLDVVTIGDASIGALLARAHRFYAGTHRGLDAVRFVRGRQITIHPTSPSPVWLEGDGELLGCLPATFEVLPEALRVQA